MLRKDIKTWLSVCYYLYSEGFFSSSSRPNVSIWVQFPPPFVPPFLPSPSRTLSEKFTIGITSGDRDLFAAIKLSHDTTVAILPLPSLIPGTVTDIIPVFNPGNLKWAMVLHTCGDDVIQSKRWQVNIKGISYSFGLVTKQCRLVMALRKLLTYSTSEILK